MSEADQKTPIIKEIPRKSADLSAWYTAVTIKAELVSYSPVRGCVVLRPYGFGLWENLQKELDARFKATGHENAYFPLLIPEHLLAKEAEHVAGFAPEVAWVTRGGREELSEPLAIRPTSETMVGIMYAEWIHSHRDLPVLINQWANVVRWEKTTRPFLRTMEFLWQEGHTAHATAEEAREETLRMLGVYRDFAERVAALPVYAGVKSANERFPGAVETFAIEALMPDGKALQCGTSHNLGQNFSRAYDITFTGADQRLQHAYTTSWGVSWPMLGAVILAHGDDRGLRLPPKLAPLEAVIIPIVHGGNAEATEKAYALRDALRSEGMRVRVDDRDYKPGWKFTEWEMRGVPLRIEIGPRDVREESASVVRRDKQRGEEGAKRNVPFGALAGVSRELLLDVQETLHREAAEFLQAHTLAVSDRDEFFRLCANRAGMVDIPWCERPACELAVKSQTTATTRVLRPLEEPGTLCVACGERAAVNAYFAQSY